MTEKRINADCRYRAAACRTSPTRPLCAFQLSHFLSLSLSIYVHTSLFLFLPWFVLSRSTPILPLALFIFLSLSKLIRPRESRGRRKSSRKFDCTRFATCTLFFYARRYVSIGKSRGTEPIVTNNAKIASDAAFYDVVNWFALDSGRSGRCQRQITFAFRYPDAAATY